LAAFRNNYLWVVCNISNIAVIFSGMTAFLSVKKKVEKFNMAVRRTGRPPW
jgi:hypothetical protein